MTTPNETMLDERAEMAARNCLLPEAGGVAFADLWRPDGIKISVTGRSTSGPEALDDIMATIDYGLEVHKLLPAPPEAMARRAQAATPKPAASGPPEPPAPPPGLDPYPTAPVKNGAPKATAAKPAEERVGTGEEIDTIPVDKIEVVMSPKGQKYVKCFGGPFSKFGVTCWPEVAGEIWNLDDMKPGDTYNVEMTARVLKQDGKVKKVIGFVD